MGIGDVFKLPYDDIYELCRWYSRGNFKTGKNSKELLSLFLKSATKTRVLRDEISNLFENSNGDINNSLNSELVILQNKKKQEKIRESRDFPLDSLESCGICDLKHSIDCCPSIPWIKRNISKRSGSCSQLITTVMSTMACMYGSKFYPSISLLSYSIIEYSSTMAAIAASI